MQTGLITALATVVSRRMDDLLAISETRVVSQLVHRSVSPDYALQVHPGQVRTPVKVSNAVNEKAIEGVIEVA